MYANYRKIAVTGGGREERLGYECQNKPDGKRCTQSRLKVEIIFDRIASELSKRSQNLNQLRYRRYLVAVHAFTKKKKAELSSEKKRIANSLTKAENEKKKLIEQRAEMISQNLFDNHTKEQFETRISELADMVEDLRYRKKNGFEKNSAHILTFYKFLELRENLVQYWNFADYEKKAIFSRTIVSNLTLQSQEVANLSFKKPFLDNEEGCFTSYGAQREVRPEPTLEHLWTWLQGTHNAPVVEEVLSMIESCKPYEGLRFPLINDLEKISGTKV